MGCSPPTTEYQNVLGTTPYDVVVPLKPSSTRQPRQGCQRPNDSSIWLTKIQIIKRQGLRAPCEKPHSTPALTSNPWSINTQIDTCFDNRCRIRISRDRKFRLLAKQSVVIQPLHYLQTRRLGTISNRRAAFAELYERAQVEDSLRRAIQAMLSKS